MSDENALPSADEKAESSKDGVPGNDAGAKPAKFNRSPRFWAIIATLCVIGILSALENTVVTTSLPFIATQLDLGENYIWVTNVFFLTSAAVQPLFGQLANIFGRRWITMIIVALFTLGSGLAGGAQNGRTLIAGRAVQGMGSGGINMIVDVIVSDLVPLRERGNYMAFVLLVYFIGTAVGPYVGGAIIQNTSWRWVFYINLPVGGVSMVMIFLFLRVTYKSNDASFAQKLRRIDYIGNLVLIASTVSVLYALTYGGTKLPWSSGRILAPLVLGLAGLVLFMGFETTRFAGEPVVPPRLFANRTSATIFAVTFLNSALLYWMLFFLPVYFQAVLGSAPTRAGVQLLPAIVVAVPAAIVAVLLLARFGKYKPLHLFGFGVNTVGLGLLTLLGPRSTAAEWVVYQMIVAAGSGFVLNTLLPACQAPLAEADQAAATAAWSFVRSFGSIWGVAIPAAMFNNYFDRLSVGRITDPAVAAQFVHGRAYEAASAAFLDTFPPAAHAEIVGVYSDSLKYVWRYSIIFSGVSFLLVFLEKQIVMRTELETEYGLEDKKSKEEEKVDPEMAAVGAKVAEKPHTMTATMHN
ncbi:Major facilitator superfamily domain, general substrate transporter [Niveomyces insectorum RCEF 264]|uniref:Major facilitator superfamily domain, general substrate transporter n=1 Tax=Niveomyces insectorum RCEF 264 TaxID=1081102 RepID=A0A167SDY3_9HYPO|nr:Major facilitator superfamily domain, general substrate transporter [Niveomyces insectorum RCEF 264]